MDKIWKESIDFINNDLIPEMIDNRCFCEPGSREFVEFDKVTVWPLEIFELKDNRELYRAKVVIKFSGEPKTFPIIIKLLSYNSDTEKNISVYNQFMNEEMFYNKMIPEYKLDIYPKCYVADMGRYGRPVIVLEDLEVLGYSKCSLLNEDNLKLCLTAIAKFHACGIKLKKNKFEKFREFYAKINEIETKENSISISSNKSWDMAVKNISKNFNDSTICHGELNNNHLVFQYDKCKPVAVKILGWNRIKHTSGIIDLKSIMNNNMMEKNIKWKNEIESNIKMDCIEKFIDFYCIAYNKELNISN